ncbi:tripartite motif-containing protein 16-like [Erpetoichthys calabaricus]|uniref:tripartite motif-containing protein 16-like n=1 Tax=Erpetoichthys calabaricus TaxID=27687 RepID=UPI002234D8F7|nr:tripartite motif-containing protein 16-like [Erpetoichthys calabaricus]
MEKAEGVMEQLEKEIEELKRREAELKELSETKDHLQFLQTFSSRCVLPADGDSLSFTVTADFSSEDLRKELSGLIKSLEKISQWVIMTRNPSAHEAPVFALQPPEPQSRDDFLKYFCPLTLDINTANRVLHLSEGNKKVTSDGTVTEYPDHPERFECWPQVLCREALTGTRCYWEVECTGDFMRIGVAYKGLSRKGASLECGLGNNDKSWCLLWYNSQYSVYHKKQQTSRLSRCCDLKVSAINTRRAETVHGYVRTLGRFKERRETIKENISDEDTEERATSTEGVSVTIMGWLGKRKSAEQEGALELDEWRKSVRI